MGGEVPMFLGGFLARGFALISLLSMGIPFPAGREKKHIIYKAFPEDMY